MTQRNKWKFFIGLIILFAGLDVLLLLSHLSRLVGAGLLILGLLILITSREKWKSRFIEILPEKLLKFSEVKRLRYIQIIILLVLFVLSYVLFIEKISLLVFAFLSFIISEILMFYPSLDKLTKEKIFLTTEFQFFVLISLFFYTRFNSIFSYPNAPNIYPIILFLILWLLEILYLYQSLAEEEIEKKKVKTIETDEKPLSEKFMHVITFNGILKKYLPFFGVLVIVGILIFNLLFENKIEIGSHDLIAILLGITLIAYNYVPKKYSVERDFVTLFLIFLFLILVVPITFIHYFYGGMPEHSNSPVIMNLLAKPTSGLLNLIGIPAEAYSDGVKIILRIESVAFPSHVTSPYIRVSIGLSCTGLYSVTTFISAFLAFIFVHFTRLNWKLGIFMGLGIFFSWLANVLRMTLIMVAGYYYGMSALLWTHNNAGIFIFMAWIGLFWGLMFKFFDIPVRK